MFGFLPESYANYQHFMQFIFLVFNGVQEAAGSYEEKHKGVPMLTPPLIANGTLAAELALKFLIFKKKGEYECGHHLLSLFNQLTEPHRTVLTERICKEAHQNETTLTENLNKISNLFEDFRYFYEHEVLGYSHFLNDFIHIVCDYAISLKLEYEDS